MKLGAYVFIIIGGLLQSCGSAMNAELYRSLKNPWLASLVSFALITAFFLGATAVMVQPLPTAQDILRMPMVGSPGRTGGRGCRLRRAETGGNGGSWNLHCSQRYRRTYHVACD
jgi:hypothetical protein